MRTADWRLPGILIYGPDGPVALAVKVGNETPVIYYLCSDHLNSITGIMNSSGTLLEEYNYGPWGRRRVDSTWTHVDAPLPSYEIRGFTGHEHLDGFNIIHMNGRLFDPENARFLNPDPVIQDLYNLQNFNRYSYCLNNPLKYIDPSGYDYWDDLRDWISGSRRKCPNPFERSDAREEFYNAINRFAKGVGGGGDWGDKPGGDPDFRANFTLWVGTGYLGDVNISGFGARAGGKLAAIDYLNISWDSNNGLQIKSFNSAESSFYVGAALLNFGGKYDHGSSSGTFTLHSGAMDINTHTADRFSPISVALHYYLIGAEFKIDMNPNVALSTYSNARQSFYETTGVPFPWRYII